MKKLILALMLVAGAAQCYGMPPTPPSSPEEELSNFEQLEGLCACYPLDNEIDQEWGVSYEFYENIDEILFKKACELGGNNPGTGILKKIYFDEIETSFNSVSDDLAKPFKPLKQAINKSKLSEKKIQSLLAEVEDLERKAEKLFSKFKLRCGKAYKTSLENATPKNILDLASKALKAMETERCDMATEFKNTISPKIDLLSTP